MKIPLTIKETQDGLIKKEFSAVQLVDAYLERIKKYNEEYNIFLTTSDEIAYSKAKKFNDLDQYTEEFFKENPLAGVVVGYKDIFFGIMVFVSTFIVVSKKNTSNII